MAQFKLLTEHISGRDACQCDIYEYFNELVLHDLTPNEIEIIEAYKKSDGIIERGERYLKYYIYFRETHMDCRGKINADIYDIITKRNINFNINTCIKPCADKIKNDIRSHEYQSVYN